MSLEKITQRTLNENISFLQEFRRSFLAKLAPFFLTGALAFGAACGGKEKKPACQDDYDCPGEQVCVSNICTEPDEPPYKRECVTDRDCVGDRVCEGGFCISPEDGCVTDQDCLEGEGCVNGVCISSSSAEKPKITEIRQGGIPIKSGRTNRDGQIFFTDKQTGESITIKVKNESGKPVSNADVIFWDGEGFETYQVIHPDFTPYLHIFSHNSFQELILKTASFVCDLYDGSSQENSKKAAKKFSDKIQSVGASKGCVLREDLESAIEDKTNALIDLSGYTPGVGDIIKPILVCMKKAVIDLPRYIIDNYLTDNEGPDDCPAYQTWLANPADLVAGRGNISPILGISGCVKSPSLEGCGSEPACTNDCSPAGKKQCFGEGYKTCGNYDADDCWEWGSLKECGANKKCQEGECTEETLEGKIAFISFRNGPLFSEIYVMNADGSSPLRLTRTVESSEYSPSWSPDNNTIAFVRSFEIYVMNANGSNPIKLTNNLFDDRSPSWSPDGSKIAFASNREGNLEIYVMNVDGSNPVNLANNPADDYDPSWSPDGSKIAFASNRGGGSHEIYVMKANGSNPINLTNSPFDDHSPSWSHDGSKIAFTSNREGNLEIYVMNVDGSNPVNLANNPADDYDPSWSPDGTKIAFVSNRDSNWEIYVMRADGSNPVNLTNNSAGDHNPSWSH